MPVRYETPQTDDGWVVGVEHNAKGLTSVELHFDIPDAFRERSDRLWEHVRFVTRSRLARLGINVKPTTSLKFGDRTASLRATVEALVQAYPVKEHLSQLIVSGLRVGRLVLCDPARRLTGDAVYQATIDHAFQLPAPVSIDAEGRVTIRPHRCVYDLVESIGEHGLLAILTREDGKTILNRLQLRREVDHIVLKPGDGIITSCTMFLHRHFVVLDTRSDTHGQHLESAILDPVTTRGTRIFLEFANLSGKTIVNPEVSAAIYAADEVRFTPRRWFGLAPADEPGILEHTKGGDDYRDLTVFFHSDAFKRDRASYAVRPVGIITDIAAARVSGKLQIQGRPTQSPKEVLRTAPRTPPERLAEVSEIAALRELSPGTEATVVMEYFPNHLEHLQLCAAAVDRRIRRLVFRSASFEHGPFLSARDHGRLADYEAFGIEIIWFNEVFEETALHVYRGRRGFFVPFRNIEAFKSSLVFAIYGSTLPLPEPQFHSLRTLLEKLQHLLGGQVAFLTGGGPGAMKQAADVAVRLGLLVGCNYLEIVDQQLQESVDFYQTFQETARHFRQRWFEIASFHLFCIGGVGTMEEIGLTLTDMKLGVIERGPLVFFGSAGDRLYWDDLKRQLDRIAESDRGPSWLRTNVLMTDDPDEVISFYERILEIGIHARR
jgi:predicted Rossmann-fold nucleotide-binding protein